MKITFICSSLENGKDGVGDYCTLLAKALTALGNQVQIVAFNDKHIGEKIEAKIIDGKIIVDVLRLPAIMPGSKKKSELFARLKQFRPDWCSLQFVPYGFNKIGIPFSLANELTAYKGSKWHIMFHELWIGRDAGKAGVAQKLVSILQKKIIKDLVLKLKPQVIHTHLPEYSQKIKALFTGINPRPLSLFSNIPCTSAGKNNDQTFRVGFFSQVSDDKSIKAFLKKLYGQLEKEGARLDIIVIGGRVSNQKLALSAVEREFSKSPVTFTYTGFVSSDDVSKFITSCDLGITPVPRHGLGKSGSVAAFIHHGVSVAAPYVYNGYQPDNIGFFSDALKKCIVFNADLNEIKMATTFARHFSGEVLVSKIALAMEADLSNEYE